MTAAGRWRRHEVLNEARRDTWVPRRRATAGAACLLLALLCACATYRPEPLSPAEGAKAIDARSLDAPRLLAFISLARAGSATPASWDLADLTLAALYYHPDLDIARAKLAEAQANLVTAGQIPNPSLSFEDLAYTAGTGAWTVGPVINFLIETGGKREHRSEAARALADAARADLVTASWQVRASVRDALLALWEARRRVALLRQRLDLQGQLVTLLEHRLTAGAASGLDVARERTAMNQISFALSEAERQVIDSQSALAAAIGVPRQALDGVAFSFDAVEHPEEPAGGDGSLRREALVNRSDVQGLLADYAAAESALALQIAHQYPDITLSPGIGYDAGHDVYRLLPAVELPVFNQNQGPIAEAQARRELTAARFTALQARIVGAVDGGLASLRAANAALATADTLARGEDQREQQVRRSFLAGEIDRPSLVAAQIERVATQQSQLDATVQQRRALGVVEDALQQPLFEHDTSLSVPLTNPRASTAPAS